MRLIHRCVLFRADAWYEQELARATDAMQRAVRFLLMELESVGNVRLEEGCSTDAWYLLPLFFATTVQAPANELDLASSATGSLLAATSFFPACGAAIVGNTPCAASRSTASSASTTLL